MNRSSFRIVAGLVVVAGLSFARPSSAETVLESSKPDGVAGEGSAMLAAPDERTGAMTESIPIDLPRARGLPQPKLTLRYNSSWTDGEAGYGWALDLPVIERRPLSGFPEFETDGTPIGPERYAFSGKLLVRICQVPSCPSEPNTAGHPDWANGWSYYRQQIDGSATRFYRSADRLTWRLLLPGGEMLEFGQHRDEAAAFGFLPALERDIASAGIVRWRLASQRDPQHPKNFVVYRWTRGLRTLMYLEDIYYTPAVANVASLPDFAHHVQLDWEDQPYIRGNYLSPEKTAPSEQRLRRIAISSMPWTSTTREIVRAYKLAYLAQREQPFLPGMGPLFHHSFLREVQMEGRCRSAILENGDGRIPESTCPSMPPMRFEYSSGALSPFRTFTSTSGASIDGAWETPLASKPNAIIPFPESMYIIDFNRDGLPDLVQGWEHTCQATVTNEISSGCSHPDLRVGMKVAITPQGAPELWCYQHYADDNLLTGSCAEGDDNYRVRSARPIVGWVNRGQSAGAPLSIQYTCMDAGDGSAGTIPRINDGTSNNELVDFLVPRGSTVIAAAGLGVAFWQKDSYRPIVVRPVTQPNFTPGSEPSNAALGGCFLDDRFNKNNFFPRWSWEAGNNGNDFAKTTPGAPSAWSDPSANEPAWMVDVDGDGLPDKLVLDTVHSWDLYNAQISFARYLEKGEPRPIGTTGGSVTGGALLGSTLPRTVQGAIAPSRTLRVIQGDNPNQNGVPTKFWYADVNGDGIQDFITSTEFDGVPLVPRVRPGNGRGRFECTAEGQPGIAPCTAGGDAPDYYTIDVVSTKKPWIVAEWTPSSDPLQARLFAPWYFADVTGDGLADIVLQRPRASGDQFVDVYVWANIDGRRFDCIGLGPDPCKVAQIDLGTGSDAAHVRLRLAIADMNGDGVNDIVSLNGQLHVISVYERTPADYATRAPRPGLLTRVDNGLGASTRVRYESLQELDLAASAAGAPWTFHSPAQVNVVTEVLVDETQYANTGVALDAPFSFRRHTVYNYREPAYDRWKRQLEGFRTVSVLRSGEQGVTETTYWYGPCQRDGAFPRALGAPAPNYDYCDGGSDDERDDTFLSRVGKPVRIDRYIPNAISQTGDHYLWSKEISYASTNWLFVPPDTDHAVIATFVSAITTHVYNDALSTSPGATESIFPHADDIHHSPVQAGAKITKREFRTLPESGQVHVVNDYGEVGVDMPVQTSRYAVANADWQYLPTSTPVSFDQDFSGNFATTARDNWLELDAKGQVIGVEATPGPDYDLDRHHGSGHATAPTPPHSAWWSRLAEFAYDGETGVVTEIRGAPWTANALSPQSCTYFALDSRYREFPSEVIVFKDGCGSSDRLVTTLAYDRAFGVPVTKTGPDGGMSVMELDPFGRTLALSLPDPSSGMFPELVTSVEYGDLSSASYVDVKTYTQHLPTPSSLRQVTLLNGLGQRVVQFSQDQGTSWIASGWTLHDVIGAVQQVRRPFATAQDPIALASSPTVISGAFGAGYFDFDHDGFGRQTTVRENGTTILRREFDRFTVDTRDQEQLPGGAHVGAYRRTVTDGRGNVKQSIDATTSIVGPIVTAVAFDGLGQPLSVTKSYGSSTPYTRTMTWDLLGRLVANDEPNTSRDGHQWRYAYDDAGRLVGTSDARGCGKNIHYDALSRVVGEDYSPCLASHADYTDGTLPGGLEAEFRYDGYEAGQVSPEPGFSDLPAFAAGRLVWVRDRGSYTRFNYDARGRTRRTSRRIAKPVDFTPTLGDAYSDHWLAQRTDFDLADRVTWRTSGVDLSELLVSGQSAETYDYSTRGLLQSIGTSYGSLIGNIEYAADGQPTSIHYGDAVGAFTGTTAGFTYDDRRRLSTYTVNRGTNWMWSWATPPASYPLPDARTTQTDLARFVFHYDGVGNPTQIEDNADPAQYLFEYAYPTKVRDMQYDDLYRVTSISYGYGASAGDAVYRSPFRAETVAGDTRPVPLQSLSTRVRQQSFTYDFLGNTTSSTDDLAANYDRSLGTIGHGEVGGPNQLRSANGMTAKYDAAGNMIELKVQRQGSCPSGASSKCAQWFAYDWDEVGQLVRARRWDFSTTVPLLAEGELPAGAPDWDLRFAYSLGVRVLESAKDSTGVARHTLDVFDTLRFAHVEFMEPAEDYDRDARLAHLSLGGGVGHIVLDPDLPYVSSPIHRFINIGDHLGSAAITIDGESSELVERTTYQAFGALESDNRSPRWSDHREDWKFTGKEEDVEVGLTYFGARYYAPYLGRWASADPLTIHGLGADLNPYAYVSGRVLRDVDPFGLEVPPENAWDLQHHGDGGWSYVDTSGAYVVGNYGDGIGSTSLGDRQFRDAFVDRLNEALMGHQAGVDVPLPGGGYVNQGDIGRATVNDLADRATPGWAKFFKPAPVYKPATDPRNKSGTIGRGIATIIEVGLSAGAAGIGAVTEEVVESRVGAKLHDIIPYRQGAKGFEKHHGVLDAWARANIPGYSSRAAPAIVLTEAQHNATRGFFNTWRAANGWSRTPVPWASVSPQQVQQLAYGMLEAAGVPAEVASAYFRSFNQYIYSLQ